MCLAFLGDSLFMGLKAWSHPKRAMYVRDMYGCIIDLIRMVPLLRVNALGICMVEAFGK